MVITSDRLVNLVIKPNQAKINYDGHSIDSAFNFFTLNGQWLTEQNYTEEIITQNKSDIQANKIANTYTLNEDELLNFLSNTNDGDKLLFHKDENTIPDILAVKVFGGWQLLTTAKQRI